MRIVSSLPAPGSISSAMFALALATAAAAGCMDGSGVDDPGPSNGTGGAGPNTGGSTAPGTGGSGSVNGTGGAISGSGGRALGTGGQVPGTGGSAPGTGGRGGATTATGGTGPGTGGSASGGFGGSGNASGTGGSTAPVNLCVWPTALGANQMVPATIAVSGTYDGAMKRFVGSGALGTATQGEGQGPLFLLAHGATLKNVIVGAPAADGIHCNGTCTLLNVWWEDVGEDAATLKGVLPTQVMTIDGGGATKAADKVFQHNGPGTMIIKNFCGQDFGKLYRSCGNCEDQYPRHVRFENLMITPRAGTSIAGVNVNYQDTATFKNINIKGAPNSVVICQRYTGNNTGAEPPKAGAGADGAVCMYAPTDIIWQ